MYKSEDGYIRYFYRIIGQWESMETTFKSYVRVGEWFINNKKIELSRIPEEHRIGDEEVDIMFLEKAVYNSSLIYLFSQFEYYINNLRIEIEKLYAKPYEKKDCRDIIKGELGNIYRISKVSTDSSKLLKTKWHKISLYKRIRNKFVHSNGLTNEIDLVNEVLEQLENEIKIIRSNDEYFEFLLSKDFLFKIVDDMRIFLNELMKLVYENNK